MIYLVILFILIIFFMSVSLFKMNLSSPPVIYLLIWGTFIIYSYFMLKENYYFSFYGIFWILTSSLFLSLGYSIKTNIKKSEMNKRVPNISWNLLILFICLSLFGFVLNAVKYGISFNIFSDFNRLQTTSNMIATQRYSGSGISTTVFEQVLNSFTYVLPLCAGYSYLYADTLKKKFIVFLTILPSILSMLITSAKLVVVAYVILFFISYYTSFIFLKKKFLKINLKNLLYSLLTALILYKLFYISFVLRIGSTTASIEKMITTKLGIYGFGHIQAFDIWLEQFWSTSNDLGFGNNTFLAFSSIFGFMTKKQGIYDFISGSSTNVFTQYRALISDFGVVFSLIIIFFIGLFLKYLYLLIISPQTKYIVTSQVLFISILFYLFYFIVSPWVYMTFVLTFLIFYFYIFIAFYINIKLKFR